MEKENEIESLSEEMKVEDEFVDTIVQRAKGDILYVVTRLAEVVVRYFQFRVRELVRIGLYVRHSYEVEYGDNEVRVMLRIVVPEDIIEKFKKEYTKRAKYIQKLIRSARIRDRHYYETRSFEEILLESEKKKENR